MRKGCFWPISAPLARATNDPNPSIVTGKKRPMAVCRNPLKSTRSGHSLILYPIELLGHWLLVYAAQVDTTVILRVFLH
jgi:hypothetical protein